MSKTIIAAATLAATLSGCGAMEALQDKWTTEVVENPTKSERPTAPEPAIKAWLQANLRDPSSAQFGPIPTAVEGYTSTKVVLQAPTLTNVNGRIRETRDHAWVIRMPINAKNAYGGYVGYKQYTFTFRGNTLIHGEATQESAERIVNELEQSLRR